MGRARLPRTVGGIEKMVERYLTACRETQKHPTVTGLAMALGFPCREDLERFAAGQGEGPLAQAIRRAKSLIEEANLQAVYCRDTSAGAKFILQSSFGYGERAPSQDLGPITVRLEGEEE